jgi:2-keto-4-pentenoate hydratase/2-oxohepta-3-ene-1,7-dioic acid hydratase in catechol pathway
VKIFGIGMNYIMHTEELEGRAYVPETPVIFTKADSALLKDGKPFFVPDDMGRIDYEGELVIRICRLGKAIPERFAYRYYDAVTVGLDFTARDMQVKARKEGLPWTICKGFDGSAIIGDWVPLQSLSEGERTDIQSLHFRLDKNGDPVQQGFTGDMIFSVDALISYLSRYFTLKTGDLLFTGTPVGVGPVAVGDLLEGFIENRKVLECRCK